MNLLAIDIGNININFAVFKGKRLIKRFIIPSRLYSKLKLKKELSKVSINASAICTVVPNKVKILKKDLNSLGIKRNLVLGKDIHAPIRNLYRNPWEVGQDRLVNAYAGIILYGAPCIVVDLGTAITFDIVSKNKEYLGGMIVPGLQISLDALFEKTALLPKIKLHAPAEFIAKTTRNSILSGIIFGYASLIDGLVVRIKEKIGRNALVIGTGGNIDLVAKFSKSIYNINRDLTLKGIKLIFEKIANK